MLHENCKREWGELKETAETFFLKADMNIYCYVVTTITAQSGPNIFCARR